MVKMVLLKKNSKYLLEYSKTNLIKLGLIPNFSIPPRFHLLTSWKLKSIKGGIVVLYYFLGRQWFIFVTIYDA